MNVAAARLALPRSPVQEGPSSADCVGFTLLLWSPILFLSRTVGLHQLCPMVAGGQGILAE